MLQDFIQLITSLQGNPFSAPVFVLLYAAACFIAPVSLFPVAGGILFGFWGGMVINLAACLIGASGAFSLARVVGRGRISAWLHRWQGHERLIQSMEDPAPGAFILLRLLGFPPFVIANYLAGLSAMRWRRFLWTSLLGLLPWTFVMTYFAHTFWNALQRAGLRGFHHAIREYGLPIMVAVTAMAAVAFLGILLEKRLGTRRPGNSC